MSLLAIFQSKPEPPAARLSRRKNLKAEQRTTDPDDDAKRKARRRVVGAIALLLTAIIAVPMVLDNEPKPLADDLQLVIPSRDSTFKPKTAPVFEEDSAVKPPPKTEPKSVATPSNKTETKPKDPVKEAPKATVGKPAKHWVQVGAFATNAKAKEVVESLAKKGFAAVTESVNVENGTVTRVRVGPFADKEQASKIKDQLAKVGLVGVLVP